MQVVIASLTLYCVFKQVCKVQVLFDKCVVNRATLKHCPEQKVSYSPPFVLLGNVSDINHPPLLRNKITLVTMSFFCTEHF